MRHAMKRNTRTHTRQYQCFVEAIELHPELITSGADQPTKEQLWSELTVELNSFGVGPSKTTEEWAKTFRCWKNAVRHKTRMNSTNGECTNLKHLTPLEERLLRVLDKKTSVGGADGIKIIDIRNGFTSIEDDILHPTESQASTSQAPSQPQSSRQRQSSRQPQSSWKPVQQLLSTSWMRSSSQQLPTSSRSPLERRVATNSLTPFQRMWLEKDRAKTGAIQRLAQSVERLAASNNKIMVMLMAQNAKLIGRLTKR